MSNAIVVTSASALELLGAEYGDLIGKHCAADGKAEKTKGAVVDMIHADPKVCAKYLGKVDRKAADAGQWKEIRDSILAIIASSYTARDRDLYFADHKDLADSNKDARNIFVKKVGSVLGKYAKSLEEREAQDALNVRQDAENDLAAKEGRDPAILTRGKGASDKRTPPEIAFDLVGKAIKSLQKIDPDQHPVDYSITQVVSTMTTAFIQMGGKVD
jgi:hypothetical protein|tara:strand:+ start:141 stop:788 length:648 start_codon:yes stop_codon:yes gene_type:complete